MEKQSRSDEQRDTSVRQRTRGVLKEEEVSSTIVPHDVTRVEVTMRSEREVGRCRNQSFLKLAT